MLKLKLNNLKKNILILAFCGFQFSTIACVCDTLSPLTESIYQSAKVVFVAELVSIQKKTEGTRLIFKINTPYKNVEKNDSITIYTNNELSMCGLDIIVGELWYIFIEQTIDGTFWASECDRSVRISSRKYSRKKYGQEINYYKKLNRINKCYFRKERRKIRLILKSIDN